MNVRRKTAAERRVAYAVAREISDAIKALGRQLDPPEMMRAMRMCSTVADQWAWQNSPDFSTDMRKVTKACRKLGVKS